MEKKKPLIHFFLPIGSYKGSYQAGFLYRLFKKYKDYFEIYQVDGTSVGALNGYGIFGDIENLRNIWFSIKSGSDIFPPSSDMYIGKEIVALFKSINSLGYSTNKKLKNIIEPNNHITEKLNISVVDLDKGECLYINCLNKNFKEYLLASCSPWLLVPPTKIDGVNYTDGGLLDRFAIKNLKDSKADIKLLIGYDKSYENPKYSNGNNLLTYATNLIEIASIKTINKDIDIIKELEEANKMIVINYNCSEELEILNVSKNLQNAIRESFENGEKEADIFAKKYLEIEELEKEEEKEEEEKDNVNYLKNYLHKNITQKLFKKK